jgi:two-component system phosphate regulon sensor histidine kinase PhoR
MKRILFLKVFGVYVLVIAVLGALIAAFSFSSIKAYYERDEARGLESLGRALTVGVDPLLDAGDRAGLDALLKKVGRQAGVRLTVIAPDGEVWADSEADPAAMENHRYRPEVQDALEGRVGLSKRFSYTVEARMLYVGIPLEKDGRVRAVLRQSRYLSEIDALLRDLRGNVFRAVLIMAVVALALAALFSLLISRSLRTLTAAAGRVAGGDFSVRVRTRRVDEFRELTGAFNAMAEELSAIFADLTRQKEELAGVIGSIREGLAVVDTQGRVTLANAAFKALSGTAAPEGRYYWESFLSAGFQDLIGRARAERSPQMTEFRVGEKTFLGTAAYLSLQDGVVAVLHDLTEARRVGDIKRDFVVNASHELRTPLAAMSGAVEILEDEGADRATVEILRRHLDRLRAIVDDLLKLAAVEDRGSVLEAKEVDLSGVARTVLDLYAPRFEEKGLSATLEAPAEGVAVKGDAYQIEQMLANLIDNAFKYTERGGVSVFVRKEPGWAVIEVSDTGIGIETEHQVRIFERFYVVDKSRSRRLGGTGLGLSIVKHIAERHGGTVEVRSRPGQGTTFTVRLPA